MSYQTFAPLFGDETKAIAFVESLMWPDGPVCPHCGCTEKVWRLKGKTARPGLWKCGACRLQFTVKIGTIFEDSHLPLSKWLFAIYLMCSSKKGVSANQLKRELSISYKSAWHLCHRVRLAMTKEPLASKLGAESHVVEIDETFVGGKAKNKHYDKRKDHGMGTVGKLAVLTLVDRDGEARTFPVKNTRRSVMFPKIVENIEGVAHIVTDDHMTYRTLGEHFAGHHYVKHSRGEYVRGLVHTNFAESYHSLLKRGIMGAYHHISEKHIERYLREFEFKWNSRSISDGERSCEAIKGGKGKRLMYGRPLITKENDSSSLRKNKTTAP
ncbi:MAG TPA: IS1595 family transposase [Alphaproteobacteria bacterium]|nr:IS1595 family transposase [Alphaproteobacteria bacterium]